MLTVPAGYHDWKYYDDWKRWALWSVVHAVGRTVTPCLIILLFKNLGIGIDGR